MRRMRYALHWKSTIFTLKTSKLTWMKQREVRKTFDWISVNCVAGMQLRSKAAVLAFVSRTIFYFYRFVVIGSMERCCLCDMPLLTRQFYVFPCQHSFHADCLVDRVDIMVYLAYSDFCPFYLTSHDRRLQNTSTLARFDVYWTCKNSYQKNSALNTVNSSHLGSIQQLTSSYMLLETSRA
jgi:hypothetical protein